LRLLLDTHLLIWLLTGDERVGEEGWSLLEDSHNSAFASTISIWEVAVKWPLRRGGRGDMPFAGKVFADALEEAGIEMLDSTPKHAAALDELPQLHSDPFDRLLLATARCENMTLLTRDANLARYGEGVRLI
jgi:PIN domain nuclease of toxin-antitoxin system